MFLKILTYLLFYSSIHFKPSVKPAVFIKLKLNVKSESESTLSFAKFISSHFPSAFDTMLDATTIRTGRGVTPAGPLRVNQCPEENDSESK